MWRRASFLAVFVVLAGWSYAPARTWTDENGNTIQANFIRVNGRMVVLQQGRKMLSLPFEKFCEDDREYIRKQLEKKGEIDTLPSEKEIARRAEREKQAGQQMGGAPGMAPGAGPGMGPRMMPRQPGGVMGGAPGAMSPMPGMSGMPNMGGAMGSGMSGPFFQGSSGSSMPGMRPGTPGMSGPNPGMSSMYPGGSTPSPYPGSSTPSPYPGSSMPPSYSGSSAMPGSSSPSMYSSSSGPTYPGSSSPSSTYPGSSSPSPYPGGSSSSYPGMSNPLGSSPLAPSNVFPSMPGGTGGGMEMVFQCESCKKEVRNAKVGDRCPHCGVVWNAERGLDGKYRDASGKEVSPWVVGGGVGSGIGALVGFVIWLVRAAGRKR